MESRAHPIDLEVQPCDEANPVEAGYWSEGTVVRGKYRILCKIGQGGMGAVYKAVHLRFGETRALKIISRELTNDASLVKRFEHEALITRRLQHPNAVHVDDIDEAEDGRPFIVMEFIDGVSLKTLIQNHSPLPVSRVCKIVKQVAAALDAAHRLGMVHRDIKPDNIMLVEAPEGERAKVLDFGIAKVKEARLGNETSEVTLTSAGMVVGTPQYMSPEQALGKRGDELDGRSDIYSLGIVAYQMLTGELPYKADTTMGMLLAHLQTPAIPVRTLRPDLQISEPIAEVVMRCLEKKPELRPQTGEALIEELERAEKCETVSLPASGTARLANPPRWGFWIAASIAVVGAAIGVWFFGWGRLAATTSKSESAPVHSVAPAASSISTQASPQPEAGMSKSLAGAAITQPAQPVLQEGPQRPKPVTQAQAMPGSYSTQVGSANSPSAAQMDSGIEKQLRGAVTEGDYFYSNGAYDEAITCYREGLKIDGASAELRRKIQRALKAKAAESTVKK